jgi:hypothetical protein
VSKSLLAEYHQAADGWQSIDTDYWVSRFRTEALPTKRKRTVRIYRGGSVERPQGMSWTTDLFTARHFARRHVAITATIEKRQVQGAVWTALAPPVAVLSSAHPMIGELGELIIDPDALLEVQILEAID